MKIDLVLTKSISRLSRNVTDCLYIVRELNQLSIPIYFEKENINTGTIDSELMLSVMSALAESESEMISQNISWSIRNKFMNGTFKLAYPPYGYKWNGQELCVNQDEAKIVKEIFHRFLSGDTIGNIQKDLNDRCILSKRNNKWSSKTIIGILKNEKYTGDVIFQKTYTDENFKKHKNHGERDSFLCRAHHEAIISYECYEAAQKLINQHKKEKCVPTTLKRYAMSGKIFCGHCSSKLIRRTHSSKQNPYIAWCCKNHIKDKDSCPMLYIRNDSLEAAITTMINKLKFAKDKILIPLQDKILSMDTNGNIRQIKNLESELLSLADKKRTLQKLAGQGYIDSILFAKEINQIQFRRDTCVKELTILQKSTSTETTSLAEIKKLLHFLDQHEMLQSYNEVLFSEFIESITILDRSKISISLKCGLTLQEELIS